MYKQLTKKHAMRGSLVSRANGWCMSKVRLHVGFILNVISELIDMHSRGVTTE